MATHKALGRGLEALFTSTHQKTKLPSMDAAAPTQARPENEIREIPVDKIVPNRHQPRTHFDPAALEELSQSIRTHGLAQPLVVTETTTPGNYELVAGERRLRASKLAGLAVVPCTIKKLSNRERFELALVENLQRQDLNALEEAVALDGLMKEYTLTQDQVATAIGKSRSAVANILRFLRLHDDVQGALRGGTISEGHAKCLAGVSEHSEQLRLLARIIAESMTVRDLEALIASSKPQKKLARNSKTPTVSPEIQKYQDQFQRLLGRRVTIKSAGSKGWIQFEFYTPEDLDLLCEKFGLLTKKETY